MKFRDRNISYKYELQIIRSFIKRGKIVSEIDLEDEYVRITINQSTNNNFFYLFTIFQTKPQN